MKKIFSILLFLSFFFLWPKDIQAVDQGGPGAGLGACTYSVKDVNGKEGPLFTGITGSSPLTWTVGNLIPGNKYRMYTKCSSFVCQYSTTQTADSTGKITHTANFPEANIKNDIWLRVDDSTSVTNPICDYHIYPSDWNILPSPTPKISAGCNLTMSPSVITSTSDITLKGGIYNVQGLSDFNVTCHGTSQGSAFCSANITGPVSKTFGVTDFTVNNSPGLHSAKSFSLNMGRNWPGDTNNVGKYHVDVNAAIQSTSFPYQIHRISCSADFSVPGGVIPTSVPTAVPTDSPFCFKCGEQDNCSGQCSTCQYCRNNATPIPPYPSLAPLCEQLPGEFFVDCRNCINSPDDSPPGKGGIWTAIGCLQPDLGSFISEQLLGVGVGIAGGIAFLYFLYGAFLFLTSRGNPEQIAMGREIIMSSLLGLALIIFSVFLLRVISVDILKIPGFS